MGICGSLMGPKSEYIEKPLVFVCFFEGQSGDGESTEELQLSSPDRAGMIFGNKDDKTRSKNANDEPLDMRWQT